MDFVQFISTPKNTTEAEPLITSITLTRGRLSGGSVYFPPGPAGKLHFLARIGIHQIIPFNTGQNIRLDNCIISLSVGIDLEEPPYRIELVTWNDSTEYDHALTLCLNLQPRNKKQQTLKQMLKDMATTEQLQTTEEKAQGK